MPKKTPDIRTIKKGTTIYGGVSPTGKTKGGGPNGKGGLANSIRQDAILKQDFTETAREITDPGREDKVRF